MMGLRFRLLYLLVAWSIVSHEGHASSAKGCIQRSSGLRPLPDPDAPPSPFCPHACLHRMAAPTFNVRAGHDPTNDAHCSMIMLLLTQSLLFHSPARLLCSARQVDLRGGRPVAGRERPAVRQAASARSARTAPGQDGSPCTHCRRRHADAPGCQALRKVYMHHRQVGPHMPETQPQPV